MQQERKGKKQQVRMKIFIKYAERTSIWIR